jgi:hypothetical protein
MYRYVVPVRLYVTVTRRIWFVVPVPYVWLAGTTSSRTCGEYGENVTLTPGTGLKLSVSFIQSI